MKQVRLHPKDIAAIADAVAKRLQEYAPRSIEADAIYTVESAAKLIALHPVTLRKRLRLGIVKGSRRAGDWRIRGSELLKLV